MKKMVKIGFSWHGYQYPRRQKSLKELENDRRTIKQILDKIGYGHIFNLDQPTYEFLFNKTDPALEVLVDELNKRPEFAWPSILVQKHYTAKELETAELLMWHCTNQAIESDYYAPYTGASQKIDTHLRICATCRAPLEQIRPLIVKKSLMKKRHISMTYNFEVILAQWVGDLFRDKGLTGFNLLPAQHYTKFYEGEPTLYQLIPTNVLHPMASSHTEFERILHCESCGRTSQYLKHMHQWGNIEYREETDIYYPRSVLEVAEDFNFTMEWFGELPLSSRKIIISQRVYRLLREYKVKDWEVVPVYFLD